MKERKEKLVYIVLFLILWVVVLTKINVKAERVRKRDVEY